MHKLSIVKTLAKIFTLGAFGAIWINILFLSCVGAFALNLIGWYISLQNPFCTERNPIYQTLVASESELVSRFSGLGITSTNRMTMTTAEGREFHGKAYWGEDRKAALVFVETRSIGDPYGSEGFLFVLPDRDIPPLWYDNYWITRLNEDVYCYKMLGR